MNSDSQSKSSPSSAPRISLPKGGGAIQGIGEKFSTNAMTGTGSLSVPLAATPGRAGFGPQLDLTYESGAGNGPFGLGWELSLPSISRKTDKGLPRYLDSRESDVFILSGSEDLVPVDRPAEVRAGHAVRKYRPRIEGLFARIERWTELESGEIHWRSFTRDNVLTVYGDSPESRIFDPCRPLHVFRWLISASYDGKGNAIRYHYVADDTTGFDTHRVSEFRRASPSNRYIKRICYGNREPLESHRPYDAGWMFEFVFDYGDEGYEDLVEREGQEFVRFDEHGTQRSWPSRKDPFSTYRSGFEIRTHRLCRRTLMVHRFPVELDTPRCLIRTTEFAYEELYTAAYLNRVVQSGYVRHAAGEYLKKRLPALDLVYSRSPLEMEHSGPFEVKEADSENLPAGIGGEYRWVDLDGEGISGVLTEAGPGWYYKHNLGQGKFARTEPLPRRPLGSLRSSTRQLLDVGGEGQLDLVDLTLGSAGFYERFQGADGLEGEWGAFRSFDSFPNLNWADPNLRFLDLTGDGIADVLITEDVAFRWHPSLREHGFGEAVRVAAPQDEDSGPRVLFSDPSQTIFLADMSGDGLTDIVRIRNHEICYWPNLGYGSFGAKVLMDRSPWFDENKLFDPRQIRLADTDGSGTTDLLYLAGNQIHVYLNQAGNSWSERKVVRGFPNPGSQSVAVMDFLGRGTACAVWSSGLPSYGQRPLRYIDLMNGVKPNLLTRVVNNLGAETVIEYRSSTEFYLADRAAGHDWVTPLPFPVHVVARVETIDLVSHHRFVSSSTYHHGYYDGVEREFRGFGRIERLDREEFSSNGNSEFRNEAAEWQVPPVLTKTWYHTGAFLGADRISRHLAHEYFRAPGSGPLLADTVLPPHVTPGDAREACRALKGSVLREEVYSLDGSPEEGLPYTAGESNSTIQMLQPRGRNRHGIFFVHNRESLAMNYERKLYETPAGVRADPQTVHTVTLDVDEFGNVLLSASLAYGRQIADHSPHLTPEDRAKQAELLMTFQQNQYTNVVDWPEAYRAPIVASSRSFELVQASFCSRPLCFGEIRRLIEVASTPGCEIEPHHINGPRVPGMEPHRRLLTETRTQYRSDSLDHLLPVGALESLAIPGESYTLAFTERILTDAYGDRVPGSDLPAGGYVDLDRDGLWWARAGRIFFSTDTNDTADDEIRRARQHFFLPVRFVDPFENTTIIAYDAHDLTPLESRDPVGNTVRSQVDYRVLETAEVTDPNGNRSRAAFDALGMIAGTAVMGKEDEHKGDSLDGFAPDLPQQIILEHLRNPLEDPWAILQEASTRLVYDLFAFDRTRHQPQPQPAAVYALRRETHAADLEPGQKTRVQHAFSYSDGLGREIQKKIQAEPAPGTDDPRWIGTGWTIFNNKGKPVRQYEPFFTPTQVFEFEAVTGVTSTLVYDPVGRVVATLNPNHTYQKTVFDPWRKELWDANDTVLIDPRTDPDIGPYLVRMPQDDYQPTWYQQRRGGQLGLREQQAAFRAASHANTPATSFSDSLGRSFIAIEHNRIRRGDTLADEFYPTRTDLDIQGNQRAVIDALGRVAMSYDYDLMKRPLHQSGGDNGERWSFNDVGNNPLRTFDSLDHRLRHEYDALRRPVALFVQQSTGIEILAERAEFGEAQPDATKFNLRGKPFRQCDQAGVVTNGEYDFKGNLLRNSRQILAEFRVAVDWSRDPAMEPEIYSSETSYDALNRPTAFSAPDQSVLRTVYNEASLLERLDVSVKSPSNFHAYVTNIDYNAKGQRELIEYGNGSSTVSTYDPLTFRLMRTETSRRSDGVRLQDLSHTYDPVGNITHIADAAQQTVFFDNQAVSASGDYVYDAIYRLIESRGREHAGGEPETTYNDLPRVHLPLPGDGQAMRRYRETYEYDAVGNILEFLHAAGSNGTWRRAYQYSEISRNNRLSKTSVGQIEERYTYDANGNMLRMSHLPSMRWDYKNQLASTQAQVVKEGMAETTYYVYDSAGQRARKVTVDPSGHHRADRLYIGAGFEVYRKFSPSQDVEVERTTLHVMDDKRRIALVECRGEVTTVRYQFDNHLGSACLELDEAAAIITYEEYYPYGSTSYQAGRSVAETSLKRYRFTGKERDDETGFNYHGARYYAPWLGRWTASDPAGLTDGSNTYAFVRNNPLQWTDSSGTQCDPTNACCIDPTLQSSEDPGFTPATDSSSSSVVASSGSSLLGTFLSLASQTSTVAAPAQTANSIEDLLTFLHAQAGFETGAVRPPTFNSRSASPFGTAAHAQATDVLDEMKAMGFYDAERIFSEVRVVNGVVTQIGGTPGGPRGSHNIDVMVARDGAPPIAVGDNVSAAAPELIGDLKYGGGVINPKYGVYGSPLATLTGRTTAGPIPDAPVFPELTTGGRWLGAAGGAFNFAGGAFMLASVDTKNDPGLLTAGKLTSGTASLVGGGMEIGGAAFGAAGVLETGAAVSGVGMIIGAPVMVYVLGHPQGIIAYDPQLAERAIREGRNPFCAQCHGPGGALDPNNDWNSRDPARRAAYMRRLQFVDLGR
ncbi:MAG: SpvB/TcaC N-terminal domain-containing protein [Terracidiphilus sp.]